MFPERANITLAAMPSRDHIVIRTWERGAGLTLACGSAACAAAVAAARLEPHRPQGDGQSARRRPRHRMARERRSRADDRAGRLRTQGPVRCGLVRRRGSRVNDERRGRHLRLPAQRRRIGSDPPRGGARRLCRHRRGQYLRGDGGGGAPGAPGDPGAAPRAARGRRSSSPAAPRRPSRRPLSP